MTSQTDYLDVTELAGDEVTHEQAAEVFKDQPLKFAAMELVPRTTDNVPETIGGFYVDGKVACERGPCRVPVKEGKHRVTVVRGGYKSYSTTIDVQAKTEISVRAALAKRPGRGDAVVAYVFAGLFAGGGIYLGLQAKNLQQDLEKELAEGTPPVDQDDPRFTRGKYFAIGADAAFGVAGLVGLAAIYYTFRDKGASSTATIDVRSLALYPDLGPDHAGLAMELSW